MAEIWKIFEFAWGSRDSPENASALASMQPLAIEDGVVEDGGVEEDDDDDDLAVDEGQEGEIPFTQPEAAEPTFEMDSESVATTEQEQSPEENLPSSQIPEMTRAEYKKWAEENPNMAQKNMDGTQPETYSPASPPTPCPEAPCSAMPPPAPPSPATVQRKKELQERLSELRWGRTG